MDDTRLDAYRFLLSAAMMHLKCDLQSLIGGFHWWNPVSLYREYRQVQCARVRAITFHNLAHFLTIDMKGFDEERFWSDISNFERRFPGRLCNYKSLFERRLNGEEVSVFGG